VQRATSRSQHSMPLLEYRKASRDVAHGVVRHDGVEALVGERQPLACVDALEAKARVQFSDASQLARVADAVFVDIEPGNLAANTLDHVRGARTCSTSNFEHVRRGCELQHGEDSAKLSHVHPTGQHENLSSTS